MNGGYMARPGIYGIMRSLEASIKADKAYLANAPLGPIQKKRLARSIAQQREELKSIRAESGHRKRKRRKTPS